MWKAKAVLLSFISVPTCDLDNKSVGFAYVKTWICPEIIFEKKNPQKLHLQANIFPPCNYDVQFQKIEKIVLNFMLFFAYVGHKGNSMIYSGI